jgi:hypothetical protein
MNDSGKNAGHVIAWQSFIPLLDTVRREEELQGAMRNEMTLIDEVENGARAWMDRRRLAIESGLKALGELSACKDPVTAAAIYGRWFIGSFNGIIADLKDAQDLAIKATEIGQSTARVMAEGFFLDPIHRA